MMLTYVLLLIALLSVALVYQYARYRRATSHSGNALVALIPISAPALANLVDVSNLEFLQRNMSRGDYRRACRERNRVLRVYVRRIAQNTRILIACAEAAQRANDSKLAEPARALLQVALQTRINALHAMVWLYVSEVIPGFVPNVGDAVRMYQSATELFPSVSSANQ
jgi:hypothetical protein